MVNRARRCFAFLVRASFAVWLSGPVLAGTIAIEEESNNRFSARQQIAAGVTQIQGALGPFDPSSFSFSEVGNLASGAIDFYSLSGQSPGAPFYAWTDNRIGTPDTILGWFDADSDVSTLITTSDDAGPGASLSSALAGFVSGDGTVNLGVTGFSDFAFAGGHTQAGDYDLFVSYDVDGLMDVDMFQFNGLRPGESYIADFTDAQFDTYLGLFGPGGSIDAIDDDGGIGLLSRLEFIAPPSGSVNLAITAFGDPSFNGDHGASGGSYTFNVNRVVPEPGSAVIWGFGCLTTAYLRRRKS